MPSPKFETWFMEGRLIPNKHYVHIKDDYSDLIEKVKYYTEHPDKAKAIIKNAHAWVAQFKNPELEKLLSLMVMEKFLITTGQIKK